MKKRNTLLLAAALSVGLFADNAWAKSFPGLRSWVALMTPKGASPAVVAPLNRSLNDAPKQAEVIERFSTFGFVPYPLAPAAFSSLTDSETVFYAAMVKRTGASVE